MAHASVFHGIISKEQTFNTRNSMLVSKKLYWRTFSSHEN